MKLYQYDDGKAVTIWFGTKKEAHAFALEQDHMTRGKARIRQVDVSNDKAGVLALLNSKGTPVGPVSKVWKISMRGGLVCASG